MQKLYNTQRDADIGTDRRVCRSLRILAIAAACTVFLGSDVIAEGDTGIIYGQFTIEAMADMSTRAFIARVDRNGDCTFELQASRSAGDLKGQMKPTHEDMAAAIDALDSRFRDRAIVFVIDAEITCDLNDIGVRDEYPPQHGQSYAIPTNDVDVWDRALRGYQAIDNSGRAILSRESLLEIIKERFSMQLPSPRLFYGPGISAYYMKSRPTLVWYEYKPKIEDLPIELQARFDDDKLNAEIMEAPLYLKPRFFFFESRFRAPLINMLRTGDAPRRYYAATRLRLFEDLEVIDLLEDAAVDGYVGDATDAENRIVNCPRPIANKKMSLDDVKAVAAKSLDYMKSGPTTGNEPREGWATFDKQNIFDLDVDSLENDWTPESQSHQLIGVVVAMCFAAFLLVAIVVGVLCYRWSNQMSQA